MTAMNAGGAILVFCVFAGLLLLVGGMHSLLSGLAELIDRALTFGAPEDTER